VRKITLIKKAQNSITFCDAGVAPPLLGPPPRAPLIELKHNMNEKQHNLKIIKKKWQ
jgi:hypothetical protein